MRNVTIERKNLASNQEVLKKFYRNYYFSLYSEKVDFNHFIADLAANPSIFRKKVSSKSFKSSSFLQVSFYKIFCKPEIGKVMTVLIKHCKIKRKSFMTFYLYSTA